MHSILRVSTPKTMREMPVQNIWTMEMVKIPKAVTYMPATKINKARINFFILFIFNFYIFIEPDQAD